MFVRGNVHHKKTESSNQPLSACLLLGGILITYLENMMYFTTQYSQTELLGNLFCSI